VKLRSLLLCGHFVSFQQVLQLTTTDMADKDADAALLDRSSVYTELTAFSRGFELQRKAPKKKDKFDPATDPIEAHMMRAEYGLWVFSPKCPDEQWVQYYEDLPDHTLAVFEAKEAAGELDISQTYPKKELWEDYNAFLFRICADSDEGACACSQPGVQVVCDDVVTGVCALDCD
jgi:hypothetical protein